MEELEILMIPFFIIIIVISLIKKYVDQKENKNNDKENSIDYFCNKNYKKIWIVFLVIIFISVIYKFGEFPKWIHVDEAGMAYDAYSIANYGVDRYLNSYPLYLQNFGGGQSVLACYIAVFFIKIFGANMISYRLPALIIYLLGVVASYLLVSKSKNKKIALLFTFLILTCPWNIENARWILDCNLYAGMFMISLYFMSIAKKNYQYILSGIFLGITLYTYCLSWISLPIFLVVWSMYMLYMKKINIKQLILIAIPLIILAIPLIYFLLLNYDIVSQTKIGIFTFPKLMDFRSNKIALSNIIETGKLSLQTIFLYENTIYIPYIFLFVIGYIKASIETIRNIKKKEYSITAVIFIAFTSLLVGLLCTKIPTPNKANVLYILILYFVTKAILDISKNSKTLLICIVILITIMFINFEYKYYTDDTKIDIYRDASLTEMTSILEENEETKKLEKYIVVYKPEPYIYPTLENKISPYEFNENIDIRMYGRYYLIMQVGKYHYYNYFVNVNEMENVDFENNNHIVIISEDCPEVVSYMETRGYEKEKFKDLYIFRNKMYK